MKQTDRTFLPREGVFPFGGLSTFEPATQLHPSLSPTFTNLLPEKGLVTKRRGYQPLGSALNGTPVALINFQTSAGVEHLVCVTTTKEYKFNTGTGVWDNITDQRTFTLTGLVSTGTTATGTTATAHGYTAGDTIVIAGANEAAYNGTFTIVSTPLTTTFTYTMLSDPVDTATGTITATADQRRTGTEDNIISWTVATGTQGTWLIFTNGLDKPRYWDGTMSKFDLLENASGWAFTNFKTCKALAMFYNHLVMVNITFNSTSSPFNIYWSDINSLVDFNTGESGTILVSDSRGTLETCVALGDRLIIYAVDSIGTLTFIGGDAIFLSEQLIQDSRLLSPRGIVNLGPYHLVMRRETISVFDGTRLLFDIGDRIFREYRSLIDLSSRLHSFAFLDRARNRVYFATPTSTSSTIFYMVEYDPADFSKNKWCRIEFASRVTAIGFYTRDVSLTWDATALAGLTWDQVNFTWDEAALQKGFPVMVLGLSNSTIMQFDDTRPSDNGSAIDSTWDSPDFVANEFLSTLARWSEIELDLKGTSADVYYSTNQGGNWTLAQSLTLTGEFTRYIVNIDVVSISLRVRVRNNSSTSWFQGRWRKVWFREQGAR